MGLNRAFGCGLKEGLARHGGGESKEARALYCDHACRLEVAWRLGRRLGLEKLVVTDVRGMSTLVDAKEARVDTIGVSQCGEHISGRKHEVIKCELTIGHKHEAVTLRPSTSGMKPATQQPITAHTAAVYAAAASHTAANGSVACRSTADAVRACISAADAARACTSAAGTVQECTSAADAVRACTRAAEAVQACTATTEAVQDSTSAADAA